MNNCLCLFFVVAISQVLDVNLMHDLNLSIWDYPRHSNTLRDTQVKDIVDANTFLHFIKRADLNATVFEFV